MYNISGKDYEDYKYEINIANHMQTQDKAPSENGSIYLIYKFS